ncbi:response regulator transcription factor [Pinibacter soli]|uniref:Helix-turn-helix transcriptional regulator n=1 Tax=Pinibacter soli TaxID=3044211 RepID=A0ABT6RBW1_9BACT|nr:helix-turn-helix transcriptional regulator [Pinibacter soli]MDI3319936.1 helix-turn-helix transcriptional regulator [Pinibacter soli]
MLSFRSTFYQRSEDKLQGNLHINTQQLLQEMSIANNAFAKTSSSFLFILDKNQHEYFYLDGNAKNILLSNYFSENNLPAALRWNNDDEKILLEKIFPAIELLCRENCFESDRLTFSFNFRVFSNEGTERIFIQIISFINSFSKEAPLHFVGTFTDITHFKNDNKIIFVAEKNNADSNDCELITRDVFSPDKNPVHLTKREIEVLKCINVGLSSKQIADKLFASLNTINNHRKNILKKTHTKNTSELISFALKQGLLQLWLLVDSCCLLANL